MGIFKMRDERSPRLLIPRWLRPTMRFRLSSCHHFDLPLLARGEMIHDLPHGIAGGRGAPGSLLCSEPGDSLQESRVVTIGPFKGAIHVGNEGACQRSWYSCFLPVVF